MTLPVFNQLKCLVGPQRELGSVPYHEWLTENGEIWTLFYRHGDGYRIRFPDLSDFDISTDGNEVRMYPVPDVATATLEHLYQNQIIPLALSQQGKLVLHAAAVDVGQGAVAFLGESGQGKSTLASSFALNGVPFLTDDGLVVEFVHDQYMLHSSLPSVRLWQDSLEALLPASTLRATSAHYSPKSRIPAGNQLLHCHESKPVLALYILGDGDTDTVSIRALRSGEVMLALLKHCYLLDQELTEPLTQHFAALGGLARQVPCFMLDYCFEYARLHEVRKAVLQHVGELKTLCADGNGMAGK